MLGSVGDGTDIVTDFEGQDLILVQINAPFATDPADLGALLTALGLTLSSGVDHTGNGSHDTAIIQGQTTLMILEGVGAVDTSDVYNAYFEIDVI